MYHIIINPAARSGRGRQIWREQIEPVLVKEDVSYRSYFSEKAGDVKRLAEEILSSQEQDPITLIILGGDGTVNEALQGISDPSRMILGYIPTGSSNDLARDLHIPTVPSEALDLILHTGKPHPMDLGTIEFPDGQRRRFGVSCGIGYDAAVCEGTLHSKAKATLNKLGLGKLTYLAIALKQLFATRATPGRLALDGDAPIDMGNMLFTAGMIHRFEGGGFMFCPNADDSDGILDLCAVGDLPRLLVLFALPTAFHGRHYRFKGISPYRAKRFTIETETPLWVHADGEVVRRSDSITVSCQQGAIQIIRPEKQE